MDKLPSALTRLSIKQLVLLCLAFTLVVKVGWQGQSNRGEPDSMSELGALDDQDDLTAEQPTTGGSPQLSYKEQMELVPELSLPGG